MNPVHHEHDPPEDWQKKLSVIVETMRDMSRHTDPQQMVRRGDWGRSEANAPANSDWGFAYG